MHTDISVYFSLKKNKLHMQDIVGYGLYTGSQPSSLHISPIPELTSWKELI